MSRVAQSAAQSAVQGILQQKTGSSGNNPLEGITGLFGEKKKK